jgi:hypothetical protein
VALKEALSQRSQSAKRRHMGRTTRRHGSDDSRDEVTVWYFKTGSRDNCSGVRYLRNWLFPSRFQSLQGLGLARLWSWIDRRGFFPPGNACAASGPDIVCWPSNQRGHTPETISASRVLGTSRFRTARNKLKVRHDLYATPVAVSHWWCRRTATVRSVWGARTP